MMPPLSPKTLVTISQLLFLFVAVLSFTTLPPSQFLPRKTMSKYDDGTSVSGSPPPAHLVILLHGFMGGPKDLSYLSRSITSSSTDEVKVYSIQGNNGRTRDGIKAGGDRAFDELESLLGQMSPNDGVKLSLVGNSLGGLYARHLAYRLFSAPTPTRTPTTTTIVPHVFATIATPHLGVAAKNQWLQLPFQPQLESIISRAIGKTGEDLFLRTSTIDSMGSDINYLNSLKKFRSRVLFANSYDTDFMVSTNSASFLSASGDTLNRPTGQITLGEEGNIFVERFEVAATSSITNLDSLGWKKHFVDLRRLLPFSRDTPWYSTRKTTTETSAELLIRFSGNRLKTVIVPTGHNIICANEGKPGYKTLYKSGRVVMDMLADIIFSE